jgi:hypothetical protein
MIEIMGTTFRPNEKLEAKINENVKSLGVSKNTYFNDALELYTGFDNNFLLAIERLSKRIGISPSDLIQRRVTHWMGIVQATAEFYGTYDYSGDTLTAGSFDFDREMHFKHEIFELEKKAIAKGLKREAQGFEPNEIDKKVMIKYRMGQAWANSAEKKRADALKAEIDGILDSED